MAKIKRALICPNCRKEFYNVELPSTITIETSCRHCHTRLLILLKKENVEIKEK